MKSYLEASLEKVPPLPWTIEKDGIYGKVKDANGASLMSFELKNEKIRKSWELIVCSVNSHSTKCKHMGGK